MTSPTQRSLAALRERGMLAEVVERWNPYTKTRKDLFGFVDIVAVLASTGDPFFVQTTSGANLAARRDKILGIAAEFPAVAALVRTGRVVLHGWAKRGGRGKRKVWTLREEIVLLEQLDPGSVSPVSIPFANG